jgi:preprotein translocase subunit SecG
MPYKPGNFLLRIAALLGVVFFISSKAVRGLMKNAAPANHDLDDPSITNAYGLSKSVVASNFPPSSDQEQARLSTHSDSELSVQREDEKLRIEYLKLDLERQKLAVNVYLEDFKARWQELLNFENENNRWITLYVTALLLVISWVLSNSSKYNGLKGLYGEGDNAYFIISIAVINAFYTFSMAFKGYQIQQIAQYQYGFIAERIWETAHVAFNEWERYRRELISGKKGPEPIRTIYYVLIGSLPTFVSYTIIGLYWFYEWWVQASRNHWASPRNWFSVVAFVLVTCSLVFSISTSSLNSKWDELLSKTEGRVKQSGQKTSQGDT